MEEEESVQVAQVDYKCAFLEFRHYKGHVEVAQYCGINL